MALFDALIDDLASRFGLGAAAAPLVREGVAHRDELGLRLGELELGVGPGDQTAAGVQPQPGGVLDRRAAQRDSELAVTARVDPAHGPGVAPAVHALELADDREGAFGGRPADGCGRVQRGSQSQHGGAVGEHAVDVGGEVLDVGQSQQPRRLGYVEIGAMGRERCRHGGHGVFVLGVVLRGVEQRGGQRGVRRRIRRAAHGAGEHTRGDVVAGAAHEHLGSRADKSVDHEGPARGIAGGQTGEQVTRVDGRGRRDDDVAGENDLVELAGVDATHRLGDR